MRIIFAWETDGNIGHIAKMAEIARTLPKKTEIFFVLRDPASVRPFMDDLKYKLLQAPFHEVPVKKGVPLNYADELRRWGYGNRQVLAATLESWRSLYEMIKPDVLFAQSAPTALIAAHDYKFKKAVFGTGYDIPPLSTPLPALQYWLKINPAALQKREEAVLGVINEARKDLGLSALKSVAEGLEPDAEFLTVFEELDHYPDREVITKLKSKYYGSFYNMESGENLSWNKSAERRVLAFLQPGMPLFKSALSALRQLPRDHDVIVVVPGIMPKARQALQKPHVRIVPGPVRLDKLMSKCDLGISSASAGISSVLARHGVPQLLLPTDAEQHMFARAVGRTGSGRGMVGRFTPPQIGALIRKILQEDSFKQAATKIARKYKDHDAPGMASRIAKELIKLAG